MHEIVLNASHFLSALTIFCQQFLLGDFRAFSKIIGQSGLVRFLIYSVLGFIWSGISKISTVLVRADLRFLTFVQSWSGPRFLFFLVLVRF